jgi:UDP-glucose 4-epimerase
VSHVLVCGGAGYVGSHMVRRLLAGGHKVSVFDNFSTGHREAVHGTCVIEGDLLDSRSLKLALEEAPVDTVMHFAALSVVSDSVRDPYRYYLNNVTGTLNLLHAMRAAGVERMVFSSSAAAYGAPTVELIDESQPVSPINPYGASKAMVERLLTDAATAYGLRAVALRYFNAAGADSSGDIGESHEPETHLIPNVLEAALSGGTMNIFGQNYPTVDGTCVRDYVHVNDLADAHLRAMEHANTTPGFHVFNLGAGAGFSVREVVDAARKVSGRPIHCELKPARDGDPSRLVASNRRAREQLGWAPVRSDLSSIISSAWRWHQSKRY